MTNGRRAVEFRDFAAVDAEAALALWQRANAVPRPTDRADVLLKRLALGDDIFVVAVAGDESSAA